MSKILSELINKFRIEKRKGALSYSQCGEDLIVDFIFRAMHITVPTYLDIGAHDPVKYSNTYFFYKYGSSGVCVEPDPELYKAFVRYRKRDKCLNCGIGSESADPTNFYLMTNSTLNTFSESEAKRYEGYGSYKIRTIRKIPIVGINSILDEYFTKRAPDFVSIDVEGLDFAIVSAIDFAKWRPKVFCIETLTYSETREEKKSHEIIDFLVSKDYLVYGDTYINTIFVDRASWVGEK